MHIFPSWFFMYKGAESTSQSKLHSASFFIISWIISKNCRVLHKSKIKWTLEKSSTNQEVCGIFPLVENTAKFYVYLAFYTAGT